MGSISSASPANPWVTDLAKSLASSTPILASSSVQSAIESASPQDLVQLSAAAQNLQVTGALFAPATTSKTISDPSSLLLQAVTSSITGTTATTQAASTDPTTLLFQAINSSLTPAGTAIPGTTSS